MAVAAGMLPPPRRDRERRPGAPRLPAAPPRGPRWLHGPLGRHASGLAAVARVPAAQIAAMNGLDPTACCWPAPSSSCRRAPPPRRAPTSPPPAPVVPAADPAPTNTRLDSGTVSSVASQHGVSGSLAAAVAYQESGFNNAMVSSANARGVMQVMPGTWTWIQDNLASTKLNPASATDNVAAGSLYLKSLLEQTGGDEATAIAGYYQGLSSVQRQGCCPRPSSTSPTCRR